MNSINAYIASLQSDFHLLIVLFIIFSLCTIFSRKISKPILFTTILVCLVTGFLSAEHKIFMSLSEGSLAFISVYLISRFGVLNLQKKVLTFSYFKNLFVQQKENEKIIGTVFPYNKYQLKFNGAKISFPDIAAQGATLITGSSGSGKTMLMESLIIQDLKNGHSVVFFDYKGDTRILQNLKSYANILNVEIFEMSSEEQNFNYDPLAHMNLTGRVEALLNTRKWSLDGADAHYRTSTQLFIQKMVTEFEPIWEKSNKENYIVNFSTFVKCYNTQSSFYDARNTLTKMIELLLTSEIKDAFTGTKDKTFDFGFEKQFLIMFSFVSGNKELANSISSLAYKDLLDHGTKEEYNPGLMLYVDEFGTLENSAVIKDILEKGRSAKIGSLIVLQNLNQIVMNSSQAYLDSLLGTMNTFIIFSGSTKNTASILSGLQIMEIENILISLKKPFKGASPTAMYISKYPYLTRDKSVDVFRFTPFTVIKDIAPLSESKQKIEEPVDSEPEEISVSESPVVITEEPEEELPDFLSFL